MFRNGREDARERIFSFGCGPDSKKSPGTSGLLHDFIISFLPLPLFSPDLTNFSHDCGLPLPSPKPRLTWWEHLLGKRRAWRLLLLPGALLILFLGSSPSWPRLQAGLSAFLRCQHWHQGLSPTTWHLVFCELGKKPGRGARGCQCFGVTV